MAVDSDQMCTVFKKHGINDSKWDLNSFLGVSMQQASDITANGDDGDAR